MIPIIWDNHQSELFSNWLNEKQYSQLFFLVDENTHTYCLTKLLADLATSIPIEILEIEAGEINKNLETSLQLWLALTELGADRHALLINVGGGMITDIGGFVASTYLRGIDFVNFPTSLLAMVDASLGGKTGIDLEHHKNRVGTFSFAQKVFINEDFLNTLPIRELKSGFAEMIKHGLIFNEKHFNDLAQIQEISVASIAPHIFNSIQVKNSIFQEDPKEQGLRKLLNFGHTIGHAIESYYLKTENPILHGEAIAMGMYYENILSHQKGLLASNEMQEINQSIQSHFQINNFSNEQLEEFWELMLLDKKNKNQQILMTLLESKGKATYNIKVSKTEFLKVFE